MKLPDSSFKTGVQSLGRENSRFATSAIASRADAVQKLMKIPADQIAEAQKEYKKNESRLGHHKAKMYMVTEENNFAAKTAGKLSMPGDQVPDYITDVTRSVDVTDPDGTVTKQISQVPMYEFRAEMFKNDMSNGLKKASMFIKDPVERATWVESMELDIEEAYGKLVGQSLAEQQKYIAIKAKTDQERLEKDGDYDSAVGIVNGRADLTAEEKEAERTRLYRGKELHSISDIVADEKATIYEVQSELDRLGKPRKERNSILTQSQTLSAMSALRTKLNRLKTKRNANKTALEKRAKEEVQNYAKYIYNADQIDLKFGDALETKLEAYNLTDLLSEFRYLKANAQMFSEIRTTGHGARRLFDGWQKDAKKMGDLKFLELLHTKVKPVLEDHEYNLTKYPRSYLTKTGVLDRRPLDYSNAQKFAVSINDRFMDDGKIEFMTGKPSPGPLDQKTELNEFKQFYDKADKETQKRFNSAIVSLGTEKATRFYNQLHDAGLSASAYNVGVAMLRGRSDVADQILEGAALMKRPEIRQLVLGDNRGAIYNRFITEAEGFFGPLQKESLHQYASDALNMYMLRAHDEGVAGVSGKLITSITDDIIGERVKFKNSIVSVPPGVPKKTYVDFLKNFTVDDVSKMGDLAGFSPGQLMNQIKNGHLQMIQYGVGQCIVYDGDRNEIVRNLDNSKFIFKFINQGMF